MDFTIDINEQPIDSSEDIKCKKSVDVTMIKKKLDRVLKENEQYNRQIQSLTNALINLRDKKLNLERQIRSTKMSWELRQKNLKKIND